MVVTAPQRGVGQPRRIASFPCWQQILFQVIGANTLFIGETQDELKINSDGNQLGDGMQITAAMGIVAMWWKGDLFVAGSVQFQFLFMAPDSTNQVVSPNQSQIPGVSQ